MTNTTQRSWMVEGKRPSRGLMLVVGVVWASLMLGQQAVAQQPTRPDQAQKSDQISGELREQVLFLISSYHGATGAKRLEQVGPADEVAAVLRELCSDASLRPSLRVRAVDELGHFEDAATVDFLRAIIEAPADESDGRTALAEQLQRHAMLSFARIGGEEAVGVLGAYLQADDLQLRLSAVDAIGRFGGDAGRVELERFRRQIEHAELKRRIEVFTGTSPP